MGTGEVRRTVTAKKKGTEAGAGSGGPGGAKGEGEALVPASTLWGSLGRQKGENGKTGGVLAGRYGLGEASC